MCKDTYISEHKRSKSDKSHDKRTVQYRIPFNGIDILLKLLDVAIFDPLQIFLSGLACADLAGFDAKALGHQHGQAASERLPATGALGKFAYR